MKSYTSESLPQFLRVLSMASCHKLDLVYFFLFLLLFGGRGTGEVTKVSRVNLGGLGSECDWSPLCEIPIVNKSIIWGEHFRRTS